MRALFPLLPDGLRASRTGLKVQIPQALFENMIDKALSKHVRPPTKKHLGTQMRKGKPVWTPRTLFDAQFPTALGSSEEVSPSRARSHLTSPSLKPHTIGLGGIRSPHRQFPDRL